jgi:hypothetical protein
MKIKLIRLGLNELLGFVRRCLSAFPDLSTFDSPIERTHRHMAIQFLLAAIFHEEREAHSIRASAAFKQSTAQSKLKLADSICFSHHSTET